MHDTPETSVEHQNATASQVPSLATICIALAFKTVHQMVLDTVIANLHERAEVGIVNVRPISLMRLTLTMPTSASSCTDLRRAFNTKLNLDQVLQGSWNYSSDLHLPGQAQFLLLYTVFQAAAVLPGKSDHAVQSVLHKVLLTHGPAYHTVSLLRQEAYGVIGCAVSKKYFVEYRLHSDHAVQSLSSAAGAASSTLSSQSAAEQSTWQ